MTISFCCAAMDGVFIGKQSSSGADRFDAGDRALSATLLQLDPNSTRWLVEGASRKRLFERRAIDVYGEELDA